jgi:hypothetical protein
MGVAATFDEGESLDAPLSAATPAKAGVQVERS